MTASTKVGAVSIPPGLIIAQIAIYKSITHKNMFVIDL